MTTTDLLLMDDEGDRLQVMRAHPSARPDQLYAEARRGVYLTREDAEALRDYLTAWLGDAEPPRLVIPDTQGCSAAPEHDCVLMDCAPADPTCPRTDHLTSSCQHGERTALEDAQAAVYGPRQEDYGHPRRNFTRTAMGWQMVLMDKLADGEYITPQDVALCMVQVKVAREAHEPKRDNRVDGAGYFETLDWLETGR